MPACGSPSPTTEEDGRAARLVAVDRDGPAHDALTRATAHGPAGLLARHRRAWRDRWLDADVAVEGDGLAQRDLRFALYHLIIAGDPESDRASIGARALTGPGYRGHVFWDTEVFCLPFFIWTHPETARALLAYRYRTLPAAKAKAAGLGYAGALYAWESADTGEETTPEWVTLPDGTPLQVLTGLQEHHIAADVAWAAWRYWQVTGDDAFMAEMGAEMVMETARFWASRTTVDAAGAHHICEVIGPDEYHEGVDDNAYTNVLAGWNLRAAGILCDRFPDVAGRLGVAAGEVERWEDVAAGLVVPFDAETMLYEQFAGFFGLENVRAVDLAPRPFTGEMVVGVDRLRTTQVVKQSDVLMLGVMLPELVDRRDAGGQLPLLRAADLARQLALAGHARPRRGAGRRPRRRPRPISTWPAASTSTTAWGTRPTACTSPPWAACGRPRCSGSAGCGPTATPCASTPGCRPPGPASRSPSAGGARGSGWTSGPTSWSWISTAPAVVAVGHGAPMPLDRGRFVARREVRRLVNGRSGVIG